MSRFMRAGAVFSALLMLTASVSPLDAYACGGRGGRGRGGFGRSSASSSSRGKSRGAYAAAPAKAKSTRSKTPAPSPVVVAAAPVAPAPYDTPPIQVAVAEPVPTVAATCDVAIVDVRLLEAVDTGAQMGARYRVRIRNLSNQPIEHGFNVALMLAADPESANGQPPVVARVESLAVDETVAVDIRLPYVAPHDGRVGRRLFVAVDSQLELSDFNTSNNLAMLDEASIPHVAPAGAVVRSAMDP